MPEIQNNTSKKSAENESWYHGPTILLLWFVGHGTMVNPGLSNPAPGQSTSLHLAS